MTRTATRSSHRRERGQFAPLVALAAVALIGGAALAIDLSLQTHDRRTLQNVTDAAALSGAQDLPVTPAASDQYQGAQDALQIIRKRMGWQSLSIGGVVSNTVWAATLASPCSPPNNPGTSCAFTKTVCSNASPAPSDLPATCDSYASLAANAHYYSITVETPAKDSNLTVPNIHTDLHYFLVQMSQDTQNYISGVLGQPVSTQAARSTAYHFAPNQGFGFALFAKTIVQTQNKGTLVVGDVYADRSIDPQSQGKAGFCAAGGLIVLGAPQNGVPGPPPPDGQAQLSHKSAYPINYDPNACTATTNNAAGGTVNQTRNPAAGCGVSGVSYAAVYDTDPNILTCVANPALGSPSEPAPSLPPAANQFGCVTPTATSPASPGYYNCPGGTALTISSSTAVLNPGVYFITHNPNCSPKNCYDVDISANITLNGVTFWLDQGATLGVHGNGTSVTINPAGGVCVPAGSAGDCRFPIYAPPGSVAQVWVTNLGANLQLYGTMYIPDGIASTWSNGYYTIQGQAIVGTWDDKGGNHPSADITYDASRNAPQVEVLKLVE